MSTLLHIDSSPLYGRSVSRELTAAFVTQWKAAHPDRPDVYGLWAERISQLYPPAAALESAGVTVFWRHRRIPLCRVLLRGAGVWWAVAALRPIRAPCADTAGCGALQHPGVSPDDVTGHHRACAGRLRVVDSCFPAVPRKFQGHLQREGCNAGINCVAV